VDQSVESGNNGVTPNTVGHISETISAPRYVTLSPACCHLPAVDTFSGGAMVTFYPGSIRASTSGNNGPVTRLGSQLRIEEKYRAN
jgi:hypothetical protein